jgi:hypothetical protein
VRFLRCVAAFAQPPPLTPPFSAGRSNPVVLVVDERSPGPSREHRPELRRHHVQLPSSRACCVLHFSSATDRSPALCPAPSSPRLCSELGALWCPPLTPAVVMTSRLICHCQSLSDPSAERPCHWEQMHHRARQPRARTLPASRPLLWVARQQWAAPSGRGPPVSRPLLCASGPNRSDPCGLKTLFKFADLIQTLENLKYLYKFDLKSEKCEINFFV